MRTMCGANVSVFFESRTETGASQSKANSKEANRHYGSKHLPSA